MHSCLYRYTSLSNTNNTQNVLIVEIRLKRNPLDNTFKLIQNYLLPIEFIHMSLCLNNEPFQLVLLNSFIFLVLPQPFHMSSRQQLQHQPWLLGVGLSIDDYFISGDIEVERLVFPEEMCFLQPGLKFTARIVDRGHIPMLYKMIIQDN